MMRGRAKGFTIIEILLFIAISGALMAIVVSSIGGRQQRVQFTDAMRDLQAFVETQLSYTQNGVIDSTGLALDCAPLPKGCIILGRALVFSVGSPLVTSYTVGGIRLTADDEAGCTQGFLYCAQPDTDTSRTSIYDILWGATFVKGSFGTGTTATRSLAFLRDPRSSSVIPVAYDNNLLSTEPNVTIKNDSTYIPASSSQIGAEVNAYYCFLSGNGRMRAALALEGTQVNMVFDPQAASGYNCQ